MKKFSLIPILCVLFLHVSLAQINREIEDKALAKAIYTFTHISDTLNPDKPHIEDMVLYLGTKMNKYSTYSAERMNEYLMKTMSAPDFDGNLVIMSGESTSDGHYTIFENQTFFSLYRSGSVNFYYPEEAPNLEWQILDDTKQIQGYEVQKAVGKHRGRIYEAWFTTELPFVGGPWKLIGLPGLILEANDIENHVKFEFLGFEKFENVDVLLNIPSYVETTKEEFWKLKEAIRKGGHAPLLLSQVPSPSRTTITPSIQLGNRGSSDPMSVLDPNRIKSVTVKKTSIKSADFNNPIERN